MDKDEECCIGDATLMLVRGGPILPGDDHRSSRQATVCYCLFLGLLERRWYSGPTLCKTTSRNNMGNIPMESNIPPGVSSSNEVFATTARILEMTSTSTTSNNRVATTKACGNALPWVALCLILFYFIPTCPSPALPSLSSIVSWSSQNFSVAIPFQESSNPSNGTVTATPNGNLVTPPQQPPQPEDSQPTDQTQTSTDVGGATARRPSTRTSALDKRSNLRRRRRTAAQPEKTKADASAPQPPQRPSSSSSSSSSPTNSREGATMLSFEKLAPFRDCHFQTPSTTMTINLLGIPERRTRSMGVTLCDPSHSLSAAHRRAILEGHWPNKVDDENATNKNINDSNTTTSHAIAAHSTESPRLFSSMAHVVIAVSPHGHKMDSKLYLLGPRSGSVPEFATRLYQFVFKEESENDSVKDHGPLGNEPSKRTNPNRVLILLFPMDQEVWTVTPPTPDDGRVGDENKGIPSFRIRHMPPDSVSLAATNKSILRYNATTMPKATTPRVSVAIGPHNPNIESLLQRHEYGSAIQVIIRSIVGSWENDDAVLRKRSQTMFDKPQTDKAQVKSRPFETTATAATTAHRITEEHTKDENSNFSDVTNDTKPKGKSDDYNGTSAVDQKEQTINGTDNNDRQIKSLWASFGWYSVEAVAFLCACLCSRCCASPCSGCSCQGPNFCCRKIQEHVDIIHARSMQGKYKASSCPICLETFRPIGESQPLLPKKSRPQNQTKYKSLWGNTPSKDEILCVGSDGFPLQMLPCGHLFDSTCWHAWRIQCGQRALTCPVCRCKVKLHLQHLKTSVPVPRHYMATDNSSTGTSTGTSNRHRSLPRRQQRRPERRRFSEGSLSSQGHRTQTPEQRRLRSLRHGSPSPRLPSSSSTTPRRTRTRTAPIPATLV